MKSLLSTSVFWHIRVIKKIVSCHEVDNGVPRFVPNSPQNHRLLTKKFQEKKFDSKFPEGIVLLNSNYFLETQCLI
jgi:hypothetical protein